MSRSRRKTPIFGHTSARSEAHDKRLWHKRWRSRERDRLTVIGSDAEHQTIHQHEVSDTWSMAKDGKGWIGPSRQHEIAVQIATRRTRLKRERDALQARLLAKWRAK